MTKPEIQIEDMARLIISCKDDEQYIEQAIVNVETLKVNQNNTFMEILAAFLPAFLQQLDPHADSIKEVSCCRISRNSQNGKTSFCALLVNQNATAILRSFRSFALRTTNFTCISCCRCPS